VIRPGEYQTISYKFMPDLRLDPMMPLALTLRLIYSDPVANESYSMLVYNDTVQIVEPHRTTPDFQLYFLYVACAGLLGLAFWILQRRLRGPKAGKKRTAKLGGSMGESLLPKKASTTEATAPGVGPSTKPSVDLDWVPEHVRATIPKSRKR
jgi:hypothetical protein